MSMFTQKQMNEIKGTLGAIAVSYVIGHFFMSVWSVIRRHPLVFTFIVVCWLGYHAVIVGFGYDVIDVQALRHTTESSYSETHGADGCDREAGMTVCSYDDGTIATYGVDDRIQRIVIPADNFTHSFELTPKFYKYVLYRMGISEYYEPTSAGMNGIVWNNIPHIREAVLTTDTYMAPHSLTVDFK